MITNTQVLAGQAANHIEYDWFNNGFNNFFESDSYTKELRKLEVFEEEFDIAEEVAFLEKIHDQAREEIAEAKNEYNDSQIDYIYNGDWIEDNFGVDRLEAIIESLVAKTSESNMLKVHLNNTLPDNNEMPTQKIKI